MEIQGYSNYLIYEDGRVYSKKTNKFLKTPVDSNGYKHFNLCENGSQDSANIHRLIAVHYIPNPHNYPCVDHIDRDRQNNHISNLRWVTQQMNCQNHTLRKDNKLRIQNIVPAGRGYRFSKTVKGKKHRKWFKTLEGAIKYKEEYLRALQ